MILSVFTSAQTKFYLVINHNVMNKKLSNPLSVPDSSSSKTLSRNLRTHSQNSSTSSLKSKQNQNKKIAFGKENLSSNIAAEGQEKKNHNQRLKKIKEKAQGQLKKKSQTEKKDMSNRVPIQVQRGKQTQSRVLYKKSQEKHTSQISSKSLLMKNPKILNSQSTKKIFHQSSSNSLMKKTPTSSNKIVKQTLKIERKSTRSQSKTKALTIKNGLTQASTQITTNQVVTEIENPFQQNEMTPKIEKISIYSDLISSKNSPLSRVAQSWQQQSRYEIKKIMISMFQIRNKLCQNSFSTTFEVRHIQTGFFFCLKVFEKIKIKQQGIQEQLISQLKFRRNVKNKSLQQLFCFFDDEVYIYFVEEYLFGFGLIQKQLQAKRKLSQKDSGILFKQIFQIVKYIHSEAYIHRDVRISNFVKCFTMIKMVDFSWVASLRFKKERDTFCGTFRYAPPELIEGENYDESIDVWSLGILLYELTTGQSPFNEGFTKRNSHNMNFPIFLSNQLVDLIGRLLSDKGVRMRIQQVLLHEWMNKWEPDGFVCKQIWNFWVL